MLELKTRRGHIRRLGSHRFSRSGRKKGARELACHTFNATIFDAIDRSSNFLSPLSVREPSGTSTFKILFFHARQLGANEVLIFALQTRAHPSSAPAAWFSPVDAPAERAFEDTWEVI